MSIQFPESPVKYDTSSLKKMVLSRSSNSGTCFSTKQQETNSRNHCHAVHTDWHNIITSNSLLSLQFGTSKTFCNSYITKFKIVQVILCAEIMPKISFEGIACPLMKPCFTHLEVLSVQRYVAQKSSSSYIESSGG